MTVRISSLLGWGLLALSTLGLAGTAGAGARVTGYDPNPAGCGGRVEIRGDGFGTGKNGRTLRYGQTGLMGTLAPVPDADWKRRSILVSLPARMGPGSYWLAIYDSSGRPESNQLRRLDVNCASELTPGGLRATAPTVVNQPQRDDDFARRQLGGSPGVSPRVGTKIAKDVERRAATDVDIGIRAVEVPREVRIGEAFAPTLEVYRTRREGSIQLRLHLASSTGPGLDWRRLRVTLQPTANATTGPASVTVTPEMVRGGQLKAVYRLEHPNGQSWIDSNPSNNTLNLAVPVVGPVTYRVDVSLEDIRIKGRCDQRSWGEWYFQLFARDKTLWNEEQSNEWPSRGYYPPSGTVDLDDGARVQGRLATSLSGVAYDHVVGVHMGGVECDQGYGVPGDRCAGVEDQVISRGAADQLFDEFALEPSEWTRGASRAVDVGDGRCGWTGRFRLNARVE